RLLPSRWFVAFLRGGAGRPWPSEAAAVRTLIGACRRSADLQRALRLLDEIEERRLAPDPFTYNTLISTCERGARPGAALELLAEMQRRLLSPEVITYNTLISACMKGDQEPTHCSTAAAPERKTPVFSAVLGGRPPSPPPPF
ncbi:unnamed protein product, partial [Prorocentrum cordatum]